MKRFFSTLCAAMASLFAASREEAYLANVGGPYATGQKTYNAEETATEDYLLVTAGTDGESQVEICGLADFPLGWTEDQLLDGEPVQVCLFGATSGVQIGRAAKAIGVGDTLYTAADGRISDAATATAYRVGTAITAATTAGDEFEWVPERSYVAESE